MQKAFHCFERTFIESQGRKRRFRGAGQSRTGGGLDGGMLGKWEMDSKAERGLWDCPASRVCVCVCVCVRVGFESVTQ